MKKLLRALHWILLSPVFVVMAAVSAAALLADKIIPPRKTKELSPKQARRTWRK